MKILKIFSVVCFMTISSFSFAKDGSSAAGSTIMVENQTGDNMALGLAEANITALGGLIKGKVGAEAQAGYVRVRVKNGTNVFVSQKTGDNFAFGQAQAGSIDICNHENAAACNQ